MLDTFFHRIRDIPVQLRNQADQSALEEVRRIAHTLKGSAPYVGAMTLSRHAAALEKATEAGTPGWQAAAHELADGVERLSKNIADYLKR